MDNLILATRYGNELREIVFRSYDFEVSTTENSYQVVINRNEYEAVPNWGRIYIPDTEYGGLFRRLGTNTKQDSISCGGYTWRGMMQKKVIRPTAGADYATDSGELNAIIKARVEDAFPGLFFGSMEDTGVTVSWQYDRYCTLEAGLRKMLKSVGYRLDIVYSQVENGVVVCAVPIVDYSKDIEFSEDMGLNFIMQMQNDGVNHLICLGSGELRDRTVIDLYVDEYGNIGTTQYYTGIQEVAEVYDYAGASDEDLYQSGVEKLRELVNKNQFEMTVNPIDEIAIGDIVGGRDYLSGMFMAAPIAGKIVRWEKGFRNIEYRLENDIQVEISGSRTRKQAAAGSVESMSDALNITPEQEDK